MAQVVKPHTRETHDTHHFGKRLAHRSITPRYERTYPASVSILGGGSSDAVYGHGVIEYKRPGLLSRQRDMEGAAGELERYLQGEAGCENEGQEKALRSMIGIRLDGPSPAGRAHS